MALMYNPVSGILPIQNGVPAGIQRSGTPTASAPAFRTPAPAPTGPVAGTPSSISFGGTPGTAGYTPDWASLISSDPGLLQAQATLQGGAINDQASRDAAIQQAVANFGDPSITASSLTGSGLGAADLGNILTPNVLGLAKTNTDAGTSTEAQLAAANTKAQQQITNALNSRGLLNSGETGYEQGQQQQNYTNSQSSARSSLLQAIQGYQQGYLTAQLARQQSLAQAYSDAANRQFANNQSIPGQAATPATTASYAGSDINGDPVYQDSGGNYYDQTGTPYTGYRQQNYGNGNTVSIGAFK